MALFWGWGQILNFTKLTKLNAGHHSLWWGRPSWPLLRFGLWLKTLVGVQNYFDDRGHLWWLRDHRRDHWNKCDGYLRSIHPGGLGGRGPSWRPGWVWWRAKSRPQATIKIGWPANEKWKLGVDFTGILKWYAQLFFSNWFFKWYSFVCFDRIDSRSSRSRSNLRKDLQWGDDLQIIVCRWEVKKCRHTKTTIKALSDCEIRINVKFHLYYYTKHSHKINGLWKNYKDLKEGSDGSSRRHLINFFFRVHFENCNFRRSFKRMHRYYNFNDHPLLLAFHFLDTAYSASNLNDPYICF